MCTNRGILLILYYLQVDWYCNEGAWSLIFSSSFLTFCGAFQVTLIIIRHFIWFFVTNSLLTHGQLHLAPLQVTLQAGVWLNYQFVSYLVGCIIYCVIDCYSTQADQVRLCELVTRACNVVPIDILPKTYTKIIMTHSALLNFQEIPFLKLAILNILVIVLKCTFPMKFTWHLSWKSQIRIVIIEALYIYRYEWSDIEYSVHCQDSQEVVIRK